uniref:NEDD4 binding protein 2 like 2 n=1 Tax=Dromaius novaehollandiae TaxID=8790 RepID=A0A8C4JBV9_DRONO|nr:NEDD4-binding protein 2-like 2 [Dromaius novaehollandiae]XP_025964655.1 NEDD4-binding protein 2-like 2 [Dromaius novaehollandiae]
MLHAECRVRLLECQDEITIEPCSKKMKSTKKAYEKLCNDDYQNIQEKVDAERTSSDLVPQYVSDNQGEHEMQKQEKIPTDVLKTLNEVLPDTNLVLSQPADSEIIQNIKNHPFVIADDAKVEDKQDPFITNNVDEGNNKNSSESFSVNRNESNDEFITSKEFIGPIYKPAERNKRDESQSCIEGRNSGRDQNELRENRTKRKEAKKTQAAAATVPEIDDELCQFYKEIHQLENDNLDSNFQAEEIKASQEQYSPYNCSQTSHEDCQQTLLGSPQPFYENGQCFSGEQKGQKASTEQQFDRETSGWKTENAFNGQVDSKFWNNSVPEFRPAWQSAESFIVPQGPLPPLPPRFNQQSHFQVLNSPPRKTNVFPSHNDELSYKNYHGYHGNNDINWHGPLPDQGANYVGHIDIQSTQASRNGNNDQNVPKNNGFCETREECWKNPKNYHTDGMHSFSFLQLPEEKLRSSQKLLLLLRGLPGSGKSTLSRFLLGQNYDGIVFSTDDYFRQQDRYTYNAAQLGDAHDWNQKRAKQAMEQGKSPIIIDNTNTQAWEMKPYVEMALEKGYRVEFREPDTWWKFDPKELEKRNKHGVTREKIAQMLERYEYQISIPIVMNSVVPPHKHIQKPPLQRRHRETILKKNPGRQLTKVKQRKKRKRSKKMKGNHTEITKKKLGGAAHHLIPDDQETSESEDDDSEEENRKSLCTFSEDPGDPITGCEEGPNDDNESLKAAVFPRERSPITESEMSTMLDSAMKNELSVESGSSFLLNFKTISNENLTKYAFDDQETDHRQKESVLESKSNFLKINDDKSSTQETECNCADYNTMLLGTKNKLSSDQITRAPDMEAKLLSLNGEKKEISQCYNSEVYDNVSDNNTEEKHALKGKNCSNGWAFFSVNLPTEELQLDFDEQVSLSSWSEDKFVGEQRQKKVRKPKQAHSNSSTELNCHQSYEEPVKEGDPLVKVTATEETANVISNGPCASPAGETCIDSVVESRDTFTHCLSQVNTPGNGPAPVTSKRKTCKRIFNLAPKFNLPRQIAANTEGRKEVQLRDDVPSKSILETEQNRILSRDSGEEHNENLTSQECSALYNGNETAYSLPTYDADSPLGDVSCSHLGQSDSSPVPSVCIISRTKEEQDGTHKQQVVDEKEGESAQASSAVTTSKPDILSSVKVVSEYPEGSNILETCGENMHKADDPEPSEALQAKDKQDVNMKPDFLGLPLSLGFAFQLVQLFGSPGLPLESLLPDDYIVPLDWKVSKMIYSLWKTSVEEKQKTNGLQNPSALSDDTVGLEDLNKNCQENQDSSETLPEIELFQGVIEENVMTHTSTGCLDTVFHQS